MLRRGCPSPISAKAIWLSLLTTALPAGAAEPNVDTFIDSSEESATAAPAPDYYDFYSLNLLSYVAEPGPALAAAPIVDFEGHFVDRSELANVLKEQRSLEFVRLWQSNHARIYIGVGPDGIAGINLSQKKTTRKKPEPPAPDYSKLIASLLESPD